MLTDTALRNFKPKPKTYKASDRDGMYVTVSPTGTVTFRFDYRLNGRRETLTIGRYGLSGISLAMAREKLLDAKKAVAEGKSPAHEKQRAKRRLTAAKNFGDMTAQWLAGARMADSTRAMRKSIVDRDILPAFQNRLLNEITADDLRALCGKVTGRGALATAVQVRDIVKQFYASFPAPVREGSASIWHLADVLAWLQAKGRYSLVSDILEVSHVGLQVNVAKEGRRLSYSASEDLKSLVG